MRVRACVRACMHTCMRISGSVNCVMTPVWFLSNHNAFQSVHVLKDLFHPFIPIIGPYCVVTPRASGRMSCAMAPSLLMARYSLASPAASGVCLIICLTRVSTHVCTHVCTHVDTHIYMHFCTSVSLSSAEPCCSQACACRWQSDDSCGASAVPCRPARRYHRWRFQLCDLLAHLWHALLAYAMLRNTHVEPCHTMPRHATSRHATHARM